MKRILSVLLLVALLFSCFLIEAPSVYAAKKAESPRAIAIVFDNSGSMYDAGDQAWCRATYAMEVFASMLNKGDVLQIYPMHPIVVGNSEYTMQTPLQITDASQAASIREILTKNAGGTPIESIDCAVNGLKTSSFQKKYLIVLTDGGTFSKNGNGLSKDRTRKELDQRIQANAGQGMTVMYLGIGSDACIPTTAQSEHFIKKQAVNTADVLSTLTEMCNLIFGRDTLPKKRVTQNSMNFDISMSKLIVFVQGTDIANLKITSANGSVGNLVSTMQTKYSTKGAADYKSVADTSLQGMIVTYENCDAGTYNIEYTGIANSVEVYYEPDADLDFVFTDSEGNVVDMNGLYEGEYKVSFGMKDAKTGKLIQSDLLGNPHYQGSYSINGKKTPITHDGYSGEVPVVLKAKDTFEAELTVTYLSGYTISKNSSDFGCPAGGVVVLVTPLGSFDVTLQAQETSVNISDLDLSKEFIAECSLDGKKVTAEEFKAITLTADCGGINYTIIPDEENLVFKIKLAATDGIAPGDYNINVEAKYADDSGREASDSVSSSITLVQPPLGKFDVEMQVEEDYLLIGELDESKEIILNLTLEGQKLTAEEFQAVTLQADCNGINYTLTPNEEDSSYTLKLLSTENIEEGRYKINVDATYVAEDGREAKDSELTSVTLSNMPLWLKWTLILLALLILFIVIWLIAHIRVMPKVVKPIECSMSFNDEDVTPNAIFNIRKNGGQMRVRSHYAGTDADIVMNVKPGKTSYLYKPQKRRSIEVVTTSVKKAGISNITNAEIGSASYRYDEEKDNLVRDPEIIKNFELRNGNEIIFSGMMPDAAGRDKGFSTNMKLKFTNK